MEEAVGISGKGSSLGGTMKSSDILMVCKKNLQAISE